MFVIFVLAFCTRFNANSEVKHDVYGKRQTANGKIETFPVFNQLCVE